VTAGITMTGSLAGRSAVVTGGSRGIGRAIAESLAAAGARVTIGYRADVEAARRVVTVLAARGSDAQAVRADLARRDGAERLIERAAARFGGPDLLINSAGIWTGAPLDRMADAMWEETMRVNLDAIFRTCRAVIPGMRRRRFGRIVNLSSTAGQRGEAGHAHYAASKGAIQALTKSLAVELAPFGITVNAVAPGWVATDMTAASLKGRAGRRIRDGIPLGRPGKPEEIAAPVAFLCTDGAAFITGEILNVNGGAVLCG